MKKGSGTRTLAIVLSLVVGGSSAAFARDVCVNIVGNGNIVFKKVKRLRPGGAIPLTGVWISAPDTIPVTGTAVMRSDGTIRFGLRAFLMEPEPPNLNPNITLTMTAADETYAGTGYWERDPGDDSPDGVAMFTSIDCATVVVP